MSTETPLNARRWLKSEKYGDHSIQIPTNEGLTEGYWLSEICEGYARAVLAEAERAHRWIPVSERLPEHDQMVLVYGVAMNLETYPYTVAQAFEDDPKKWFDCPNVTHWMPLPSSPTEAADLLAGMRP